DRQRGVRCVVRLHSRWGRKDHRDDALRRSCHRTRSADLPNGGEGALLGARRVAEWAASGIRALPRRVEMRGGPAMRHSFMGTRLSDDDLVSRRDDWGADEEAERYVRPGDIRTERSGRIPSSPSVPAPAHRRIAPTLTDEVLAADSWPVSAVSSVSILPPAP